MNKAELREKLAAIEHERWADWQRYQHGLCTPGVEPYTDERDGSLCIPKASVEHWERQIATPYAELSEREQASDMEQVDRYWPLIVETFAAWIAREGCIGSDTINIDEAQDMADRFKEAWA